MKAGVLSHTINADFSRQNENRRLELTANQIFRELLALPRRRSRPTLNKPVPRAVDFYIQAGGSGAS